MDAGAGRDNRGFRHTAIYIYIYIHYIYTHIIYIYIHTYTHAYLVLSVFTCFTVSGTLTNWSLIVGQLLPGSLGALRASNATSSGNQGLGFGVWGLGFRVYRVQGSGV